MVLYLCNRAWELGYALGYAGMFEILGTYPVLAALQLVAIVLGLLQVQAVRVFAAAGRLAVGPSVTGYL